MKRVLFLLAHPNLNRSRSNRLIGEAVHGLEGVTMRTLYDLYPRFHINVAAEQELLVSHDMIFVQHPFYWYSMPPLMKMWLDEVLQSGFAYGPGGKALVGKDMQVSITAGGSENAYRPEGQNRFSVETLLTPWDQTAHLCGMKWHAPIVFYHSLRADQEQMKKHAQDIRHRLQTYIRSEGP